MGLLSKHNNINNFIWEHLLFLEWRKKEMKKATGLKEIKDSVKVFKRKMYSCN